MKIISETMLWLTARRIFISAFIIVIHTNLATASASGSYWNCYNGTDVKQSAAGWLFESLNH